MIKPPVFEELLPGDKEIGAKGFYLLHPMPKEDIRTSQTWRLKHILNTMCLSVAHNPQSISKTGRAGLSVARRETQMRINEELARRPRINFEQRIMIHQAFLSASMQGIIHPLATKQERNTRRDSASVDFDVVSAFLANKHPVTIQQAINQGSILLIRNFMGNLMAGTLPYQPISTCESGYHFEQIPVEWYYQKGHGTLTQIDNMWLQHPINTSVLETQSTAVLQFLSKWLQSSTDETAEKWGLATFSIPPMGNGDEKSFQDARAQSKTMIDNVLRNRPVLNLWGYDRLYEAAVMSARLSSEVLSVMKANRIPAALLDTIPDYDAHLPMNRLELLGTGSCAFCQRLEIWRENLDEDEVMVKASVGH